ncbi:MAG: T9SS type A sorting domain-containing protein [Saprospiraceae bacterium]|nr:T9SS type A sorting domain-containing protein [Saprospiraceae bacterium]MCF8251506.1 T9SS type A sorting domain-containing protein [Saprospiraceae bacterium]MCF8280757.1 T9SS type A sorting domain-containing protein [Bacteroidales bacterium]MCF8313366.1 T9SS type A sorting domain-containing protein [Saprospiraceae bacterium]MCF8441814.1 T9SS type A sorting domain-containing protein [Saprospiraceae bacterium]
MKNKFLLLLLAAMFGQGLNAQMNVTLHMHQKLGDQPFVLNSAVTVPSDYLVKVTRLQYYVSEIKIVHDGGQVTPVTDLHLLVTAQEDSIFGLGSFDVTIIEGIEFSIGVDPAFNHLDPASYPNDHPLAPKNPVMHWGWAAGYRFIAFEGTSSNNGTTFPDAFQIHTVDDANYLAVTLPVSGVVDGDHLAINVDADYAQLLMDINVQGGLISHAATGPSAKLAGNMQNFVFSPSVVSGTTEPGIAGTFVISPNPASGAAVVKYDLPGYDQLTLTVSDLAGRTVFTQKLNGSQQSVSLETNWQSGIYVARIFSGDKFLALEKLVVK